jgi:hypothetical protein
MRERQLSVAKLHEAAETGRKIRHKKDFLEQTISDLDKSLETQYRILSNLP